MGKNFEDLVLWFNGEMVPFEKAKIHVSTPCARFGINIFEGLRGYWNEKEKELYCFKLFEHYERLFSSGKLLNLEIPYSINDLIEHLSLTLRANNFKEDVQIRHVVFLDGYGGVNSNSPVGVYIHPFPNGRAYNLEEGISVNVSSWNRINDQSMPPRIKAGSNYNNSRLAQLDSKQKGFDTCILLNSDGKVSEAPGACLFIYRKGKLLTPPVTAGILESITRDFILYFSKNHLGLDIEERNIDRTELYVADEIFLCGTAAEVVPVVEVDNFPIGIGKPGEITKKIIHFYFDCVRGEKEGLKKFLTPIYNRNLE